MKSPLDLSPKERLLLYVGELLSARGDPRVEGPWRYWSPLAIKTLLMTQGDASYPEPPDPPPAPEDPDGWPREEYEANRRIYYDLVDAFENAVVYCEEQGLALRFATRGALEW